MSESLSAIVVAIDLCDDCRVCSRCGVLRSSGRSPVREGTRMSWETAAKLAQRVADQFEWATTPGGERRCTTPPFPDMRIVTEERSSGGTSSWPEPPLNQDWDDFVKLCWHAAVCRVRSGIDVRISEGGLTINGRPVPGVYGVSVPRTSISPRSYFEVWTYINGIEAGALAVTPLPPDDSDPGAWRTT